ncbi:hypothetical protein RhiirA4_343309 [Rhizophagus irregularis]|uniref:Nitrogen regulatory protein areA GATA-like domain-containing protein n=1 Tax=Rhizophagus irregularis TaxID=588596 RepID=A0A2I1GHJ3_9GLOM|nr:hypothetical protein RhiirA4_343309 [Rhizophagus irregularis]
MQIQSTNMSPDDNLSGIIPGLQYAPKICVDYLSHEWTQEDDIWTSWKVMSKQKKELSNGIRLENASWRTWAKQKYNLKTVNPKKLNWLKDSDVTWLYGPLHTAWTSNSETSPKLQTTEDKLNLLASTTSTKSCLKKKSISEILRPKGRYGPLVSSNSDTQLYRRDKEKDRDNDSDASDCETASTCSSISGPTTPTTGPTKLPVERINRKIQFNDRVEQCIAVESDDDVDELNDSDSSSDDGILMKNSPPKKKNRDLSTICKLAPTKLKEDRIHNNEYSSLYSSSRRRANSSNSLSSSSTVPSTSTSSTSSTTTTTSTTSTTTTSSSSQDQSWMYDDDDDLDIDLIDFDIPTYHHAEAIIPPPNNFNEDDEEDKDDIVDKAVNIANGVREIMHWCSDMVLKGRIF